jgi:hypothetical protein
MIAQRVQRQFVQGGVPGGVHVRELWAWLAAANVGWRLIPCQTNADGRPAAPQPC